MCCYSIGQSLIRIFYKLLCGINAHFSYALMNKHKGGKKMISFKKVYSKAVQAHALLMEAIDFYKDHKPEIDSIAKRFGDYGKSLKKMVVKTKFIEDPNFKEMGYTREDVEEFIKGKDTVTVGDYMDRFGPDVLNPKIVFDWLIARGIVKKTNHGTYKVIKQGVDA